jgi:hypothetical protein
MIEQGELSELLFSVEASKLGFNVSLPISTNSKYDAVVDNGKTLIRVQIKSVAVENKSGKYTVNVCYGNTKKVNYTTEEADFFAILIIPKATWYIIPVSEISTFTIQVDPSITLGNHGDLKYERYRSKWSQLKTWNRPITKTKYKKK